MKLNELLNESREEDDEYDAFMNRFQDMSEEEMLAAVRENPDDIMYMDKATKRVMLTAVQQDGSVIMNFLYDLDVNKDKEIITTALLDPKFIKHAGRYNEVVKDLFANNALLMNKWLRYGENIRGE